MAIIPVTAIFALSPAHVDADQKINYRTPQANKIYNQAACPVHETHNHIHMLMMNNGIDQSVNSWVGNNDQACENSFNSYQCLMSSMMMLRIFIYAFVKSKL